MKVFIHSSSKDIDIVQDLAHRLDAAGIEVHWANESAKSDKTISATNRALREADEIFVLLTNESVDDPNLMAALGAAYSTRRHVTPIVVGLQTPQIPSLIKSLKYIKYPDLNRYITDLATRNKSGLASSRRGAKVTSGRILFKLRAYTLRKSFAMDEEVKDLEIINRHANELNKEALDVLDYQMALLSEHDLNPLTVTG